MQPNNQAIETLSGLEISLAWLRQTIDAEITRFAVEWVKTNPLTSVRRVFLEYYGGLPGCHSVIVKIIAPNWPDDPHGPDRERWFYSRLFPRLGFRRPRQYLVTVDPVTNCRVIVLEDLANDYRFLPPTHRWSLDEIRCALRSYAWLHEKGQTCLDSADERKLLWQTELQRRAWQADEILTLVEDLVRRGTWPQITGIERFVVRTLADQVCFRERPATLLHNDVYPPNIALPDDLTSEAVLLDWEMLGWGMAELDLAYMFMQPFHSSESVDRRAALKAYWDERHALGSVVPAPSEQWEVQRHADALWALSLLPVAHRAVFVPYPAGSAARSYWDAMIDVLYECILRMCRSS